MMQNGHLIGAGILKNSTSPTNLILFPRAVVIVHKAHSFMHHRNVHYTGVTRARRAAIVLGDHWGIQNCAKWPRVDDRRTFLPLFLGAARRTGAYFSRVAEAE